MCSSDLTLKDFLKRNFHNTNSYLIKDLCNNPSIPESFFIEENLVSRCGHNFVNIIRSKNLFDKLYNIFNRSRSIHLDELTIWPYFDEDYLKRVSSKSRQFWENYCYNCPSVTEKIIKKYWEQIPPSAKQLLCFNSVFLDSCSSSFRNEIFRDHFTSAILSLNYKDKFCVNRYIISHLNCHFTPNCTVRDKLLSNDHVLQKVSWEFLIRYRDFIPTEKWLTVFSRSDLTFDLYRKYFVFRRQYAQHSLLLTFYPEQHNIKDVMMESSYFTLFLRYGHLDEDFLQKFFMQDDISFDHLLKLTARENYGKFLVAKFCELTLDPRLYISLDLSHSVLYEKVRHQIKSFPEESYKLNLRFLSLNQKLPLRFFEDFASDFSLLEKGHIHSLTQHILRFPVKSVKKIIEQFYEFLDIQGLIANNYVNYETIRQKEKNETYFLLRVRSLIFSPNLESTRREELARRYLNFSASDQDIFRVFSCPYFRVSFYQEILNEHCHARSLLYLLANNKYIAQRELEIQKVLYDLHYNSRNEIVVNVMTVLNQELWQFLSW